MVETSHLLSYYSVERDVYFRLLECLFCPVFLCHVLISPAEGGVHGTDRRWWGDVCETVAVGA